MLKTIRNAFKIADIRKRLLYTLFMLIIIRLGSNIPTPGVKEGVFANFFANLAGSGGIAHCKRLYAYRKALRAAARADNSAIYVRGR